MNPQEQELQYPWDEKLPEAGHALTVADGVRWIRMPLPFALDHINLWLLRDRIDGRDGWTVVDCGIDRSEVRDTWESVFAQALDGLPVLRVIVTHMHPDHVGLAHWLCERWQAPLSMSMTDYAVARLWTGSSVKDTSQAGSGPVGDAAARHFARHGLVDPEAQAMIRQRHDYYARLVPDMPRQFHRLMHGQDVQIGGRPWRIIVGYGHAPEHVSLWCPTLGTLISGDMVLPRISTNISVFDLEPEANPLPLYLDSLKAYDNLPADALVLPSHGRPFRGLHRRIAQQQTHHAERLAEVLAACGHPQSAHDLLPVLFHRKLDMHQLGFAMGESVAHLHALYFQGALTRALGEDGIYRFQQA
ncbi:MBL fold metallo-hydrolase [Castellaniella sp.]|uniref:MBL fold metallo-hydrolase n=1 Tax=Castellaniella sp. TaxID=1955812 RepID=UPI002AFFEDAA|nr:MBL fold metallo-hydrolase [Castellaniella sp.]